MRVVSARRRRSSKTYVRDPRHTRLAPVLACGPRLPQLWSEVFLVLQLLAAIRRKEVGRKAAEAPRPACRHDVSCGGSLSPIRPPQNTATVGESFPCRSFEIFLRGLLVA